MNSLSLFLGHTKTSPRGDFAALFESATVEVASTLSFATRDEYLEWVIAWKHAYRFLSAEIRFARISLRARQSRLPARKQAFAQREAALLRQFAALGEAPPLVVDARKVALTVWGGPPVAPKAARYLLALRRAGKRVAAAAARRLRETT